MLVTRLPQKFVTNIERCFKVHIQCSFGHHLEHQLGHQPKFLNMVKIKFLAKISGKVMNANVELDWTIAVRSAMIAVMERQPPAAMQTLQMLTRQQQMSTILKALNLKILGN